MKLSRNPKLVDGRRSDGEYGEGRYAERIERGTLALENHCHKHHRGHDGGTDYRGCQPGHYGEHPQCHNREAHAELAPSGKEQGEKQKIYHPGYYGHMEAAQCQDMGYA